MSTTTPMYFSLTEGISLLYMGFLMMSLLVFCLYKFWKVKSNNLFD